MTKETSTAVENYLNRPDIHRRWENAYRTRENEAFYDLVFDYLTRWLDVPDNSLFLDLGCGVCAHSIRLAKRGFNVHSVDISESILAIATAQVKRAGFKNRIALHRQSILCLSFRDATFPYILCWGVLMHIPDVDRAIAEIVRVLHPGGILIVSEANMHSLHSRGLRLLRALRGGGPGTHMRPCGAETWEEHSNGKLVTRHANIPWLIKEFARQGLRLKLRSAGQFTELYTRVPSERLQRFIHAFNRMWFRFIALPQPAFGNILIFEKS